MPNNLLRLHLPGPLAFPAAGLQETSPPPRRCLHSTPRCASRQACGSGITRSCLHLQSAQPSIASILSRSVLKRGSGMPPYWLGRVATEADISCGQCAGSTATEMGLFACFGPPKVTAAGDGEEAVLGPDGLVKGSSPLGSRRDSAPFKRDSRTATAITAAANSAPNSGVELANARALVRALVRKPESRCDLRGPVAASDSKHLRPGRAAVDARP